MKKSRRSDLKAISKVNGMIIMVLMAIILVAGGIFVMSGIFSTTASLTLSGPRLFLTISNSYELGSDDLQVRIDGSDNMRIVDGAIYGYVNFTDAGQNGRISNGDFFTNDGQTPVVIQLVLVSNGVDRIIAEAEF